MKIKFGVKLARLQPQMVLAALIVEECYSLYGAECEITSGSDGVHKGKPVKGDTLDPHYVGKALDFSLHGLLAGDESLLVKELESELGPEFVVILEVGVCIHVQWGHIA